MRGWHAATQFPYHLSLVATDPSKERHLCIVTNNNWEKGVSDPFAHLCIEKSSRLHRRHSKNTETRPQCPMQV